MSAAGTVGAPRPPTDTIEILWQELVEEVRRVLREVEEEQARDGTPCTMEESEHDR